MTPRSPKQQPKTTTISRRLRIGADQNISAQTPELSHLKGLRPRRAATLPRHISGNFQTEEAPTPLCDLSAVLNIYTRSNSSNPSALAQNAPSDLLLPQPPDFPPYQSPQRSPTNFSQPSTNSEFDPFEEQRTSNLDLLPSPLPSISGAHAVVDYELRLSAEPVHTQDPSIQLQDMSTLGFMMPAQYSAVSHHYGSPPSLVSQNYPPMGQQSYAESHTSSSTAHTPKAQHNILPPYQHSPAPRSPYQPMAYPPTSSDSSLMPTPHTYTYPGVHRQGLSTLTSSSSSYSPHPLYPPSSYEMGYSSLPSTMYPPTSTAAGYTSYEPSGLAPPPGSSGISSSPLSQGNIPHALSPRPKPQCWEHGCNGRQFSTFSNLLRHQREKSGTAQKSYCPKCGAEFTRTTARNGHMAHEKCKPRRASDWSK